MKNTYLLPALFGSALFAITGCNVPTGSISDPVITQTGAVVDSAIEGLEYYTASQSGFTGPNGSFQYLPGESIVFKVGDIELPAILAEELLTPLNLASTDLVNDVMATNIARFLQALDSDGDPSNGITIDTTAHQDALNTSIDFTKIDFDAEVAQHLGISLPSREDARDHFETTLAGLIDGTVFQEMIGGQSQSLTHGSGYLSSEFSDTCQDLGDLLIPGGLNLFTMTACFNADDDGGTLSIGGIEHTISWSVDSEGGLLLSADTGWNVRLIRLEDGSALVQTVGLPGYESLGDISMLNDISAYLP